LSENRSTSRVVRRKDKTTSHGHTDLDNGVTEGKTRIKALARVVQGKKKLNSPLLIAGFPGAGLVGSISTSYIIKKLHMNQIACVESEFILPGVIYAEGKLRHPFRLYSNEEGDVCVLVCEAPIMIQGMYSVLDTVMKWALNNKVKETIVLDGIGREGLPDSKRKPMILSSDGRQADAASLLEDNDDATMTKPGEKNDDAGNNIHLPTAFMGGMSGALLSSCLSNGLASKALLVSASRGIPDPEGAALLIESLGEISDIKSLKIDTQQLRKQGQALREKMEKIMQSFAEQQQQQQGLNPSPPPPIRDGIMYG
jgi:uncharacterized protein